MAYAWPPERSPQPDHGGHDDRRSWIHLPGPGHSPDTHLTEAATAMLYKHMP